MNSLVPHLKQQMLLRGTQTIRYVSREGPVKCGIRSLFAVGVGLRDNRRCCFPSRFSCRLNA
jgi:hypothetical protein